MLHTRLLAFLALVILPAPAPGHNDVSKTIKTLSAKIEESPSADLYYQRATEFRALREKEHAIEDLRSALKHEPRHRPAKISLIRALGKSAEALHLAIQLQSSSAHAENSIEPTYLVAKIHHLRGNPKDALTICANLQKLSRNHSTEIDLLHAEVLLALKRPADASTILKMPGNARTPSSSETIGSTPPSPPNKPAKSSPSSTGKFPLPAFAPPGSSAAPAPP